MGKTGKGENAFWATATGLLAAILTNRLSLTYPWLTAMTLSLFIANYTISWIREKF
jgi:hypothetical protein